ncbi:CBS domain-containing protein [Methanocaldococcus infernus]
MNVLKIVESKEIIIIPPTWTIRETLTTMNEKGFRRLPIANPGNKKLVGIVTAMDIVDFIGGGDKYNLIREKHNRNFYSAINEPIKEIMTKEVITLNENADVDEAIDLFLNRGVGGVPIVDKEDRVISLISERDVIKYFLDDIDGVVKDYMEKNVIYATPGERLKDVARTMLRNKFRRLPVVSKGRLVGMITATDFIKLLGSDWAFNHMKTGNVREITNVRMEEIMRRDVITAREDDNLKKIAEIMIKENIGAIPVVDGEKLVGIITEKDIVSSLNK